MDQAQMLFVSQCKHPTVTTLRAVCTSQASKKKKKKTPGNTVAHLHVMLPLPT
jgi:hypothetical protein